MRCRARSTTSAAVSHGSNWGVSTNTAIFRRSTAKVTVPAVGRRKPATTEMIVVFPAPLGPINP